jgi:spore maturation protein CgeB
MVGRYDHFWTIQGPGFAAELRALGQRFADHVPLAFDPEVHRPPDTPAGPPIDVSFVGSAYPNRVVLLRALADVPGLLVFGPGFARDPVLRPLVAHDGTVPYDRIPALFAASRINLNLSSAVAPEAFDRPKDFANPRTFEIAGCGGFQLAEALSPVGEFFTPGAELVTFADAAEARDRIAHFLAHPDQRAAIARAGHARALQAHTYDRRLGDALARAAAADPRIGG